MAATHRDLLIGLFASQLHIVPASSLASAMAAWIDAPKSRFGEALVRRGLLTDARLALIEALADAAIQANNGDAARALEALGGSRCIQDSFLGVVSITSRGDVTKGRIVDLDLAKPGTDSSLGVEETPGRYTFLGEYARGGMGRVLLTHDDHFGRDIALKELLPAVDPHADTVHDKAELTPVRMAVPVIARFLQEARITGQLEHPAIVPVYELGHRRDGTLYYTMKLVRGRTLSESLDAYRSLDKRLALLPHVLDLCHAIAYAHSRNVIHRDIKPSNVMIGEFGETVVIDWGLAKVIGGEDLHRDELTQALARMKLDDTASGIGTHYGTAVGTPAYMPPEQADGLLDLVDKRSDVYSLGAVLYELLTGRPPFTGASAKEVLDAAAKGAPPSIESIAPGAPRELVAICNCAMQRDPANRYQNAQHLAEEIGRFLSGAIVQAHHYSVWERARRFVRRYKAVLATATVALLLLATTGIVYNIRLIAAHNREREQRIAAEEANRRLVWENYSVTLVAAQKNMADRNYPRALALLNQTPQLHRDWEWGRLKAECEPQIWALSDANMNGGTYGMPAGIRVSPSGRYLLMHRFFSGIKHVYDLEQARNVYAEVTGAYIGWPQCTQFGPDNQSFVTAIDAQRVGWWDFTSHQQRAVFDAGHGEIRSMAISPDGKRFAGFVVENETQARIALWNNLGGAPIVEFPVADVAIEYPEIGGVSQNEQYFFPTQGGVLDFFKDSNRLAFFDTKLGVLNVDTGTIQYAGPARLVAAFAPESAMAVSRAPNGDLKVFNLETLERLSRFPTHGGLIRDLALRPDGSQVIAGSDVFVWDTATGLQQYAAPHGGFSPRYSPNGRVLFTISDYKFYAWDTNTIRDTEYVDLRSERRPDANLDLTFLFGRQPVYRFSHDKAKLAVVSLDGIVDIWSVPDFTLSATWKTGKGVSKSVRFSPDDRVLAITSADAIQLWDLESQTITREFTPDSGIEMTCAAFSPDATKLAIGTQILNGRSDDGTNLAAVIDLVSGDEIYTVAGHPGSCNFVEFSPDGKLLLTGGYGAVSVEGAVSLYFWDAATGAQLLGTIERINWPWHVDFNRDNSLMLALGLGREPVLFDLTLMKERYRIPNAEGRQVFFHPGGKRFALLSAMGMRIFATEDGRELITTPEGRLPGQFTADGRSLICRRNPRTMMILKTTPWLDSSPEQQFKRGLEEVRQLTGIAAP